VAFGVFAEPPRAEGQKPPAPPTPPAETVLDRGGRGNLFGPPEPDPAESDDPFAQSDGPLFQVGGGAPLGFAGPSKVPEREVQADSHFIPVEDRWRTPFPEWDRAGLGHPYLVDYPYVQGSWWDSYNQNVLKGDYPIFGQNTFLEVTALSDALFEPRQLPAANSASDRTGTAPTRPFFEKPDQFFYSHLFLVTADLFQGATSFKPVDWRVRVTPAFNVNYTAADEQALGTPPVRRSLSSGHSWSTLQEWFVEKELADLSPNYDFVSVRVGTQPFISDFRGFVFNDANRGVRLFGDLEANRDQFNLAYFNQQFKDQNSRLNSFNSRDQQVVIANFFRQDFIWPGYTAEASVHYNHDNPGGTGSHVLDVAYLGLASDGHINRIDVNGAVYWAVGHDSMNPISKSAQDISAWMAALELSYDLDWAHLRFSFFYASGDGDIRNKTATGFDSIIDNPNFAGGPFSFFQHQGIPLFGTNLTNRFSLLPDLRSSNLNAESNFVNPGIMIGTLGADLDLTPKARMFNNFNLLWFDKTNVLEQFLAKPHIDRFVGGDLSTGVEYRPLLNNNVIVTLGAAVLIPGQGFKELYDRRVPDARELYFGFLDVTLAY
jgi:hypothetical protein